MSDKPSVLVLPDCDGKSPITLDELKDITPIKFIIVITTTAANVCDKLEVASRVSLWAKEAGLPERRYVTTSGDTIELALGTVSAGTHDVDFVAVSARSPPRLRALAERQVPIRWPGATRVDALSDGRLTVYKT
jgi:hypothetical protein